MSKPIISFTVILLSLGFSILYVRPLYGQIQSHRTAIVDIDQTLTRAKTIDTLISETKKKLGGIAGNDRARFSVFLPETIDDLRFANAIQRLGLSRGLVIDGIKVTSASQGASKDANSSRRGFSAAVQNTLSLDRTPQSLPGQTTTGGQSQGGKYQTTHASFSVVASYKAFHDLLIDLEQSLGLINVTSLSFSAVAGSSEESKQASVPLYTYAVEIETYSLQ